MTSYVQGSWLALVTPQSVAMLADAPAAALPVLAEALSQRGLAGFIDALTEATGTTASSLPEFAVAIAEDGGIRVAVRGASTVTRVGGGGTPTLVGVGVTGWAEAVWEDSGAVDIASPETADGSELWIVEGAVRAARVRWSPSEPYAALAREPEPVALAREPEPASLPATTPAAEPPADAASSTPATPAPPAAPPVTAPVPEPHATADEDGDVSAETLAPAYDTVAEDSGRAAPDEEFGPLWGSTVATPPTSAARDEGTPISSLPSFTPPDQPAPGAEDPSSPPPSVQGPPPSKTPPAATEVPPASAPAPGDHDGATVSVAALRAMTSAPPAAAGEAPSTPSFASADQLAKERKGRAVVSTGAVVTLDKNVIIGRTPKASRVTGEMPHLVTVPSPSQDISRSHCELRVEGTAVVAIDLNTTNGTLVLRPGADPVRLHPGEPHVLLTGDVIDLGDGVTITLEDLP